MLAGHIVFGMYFGIGPIVLLVESNRCTATGETTTAIQGQAADCNEGGCLRRDGTIGSQHNDLKGRAITNESGLLNFPQLKPGAYLVKFQATGFEPQESCAGPKFDCRSGR